MQEMWSNRISFSSEYPKSDTNSNEKYKNCHIIFILLIFRQFVNIVKFFVTISTMVACIQCISKANPCPSILFLIKECAKYKALFAVGLTKITKIIQWNKIVAKVFSTLFTLHIMCALCALFYWKCWFWDLKGIFVWEHSHINSAVDQQMHNFMYTKMNYSAFLEIKSQQPEKHSTCLQENFTIRIHVDCKLLILMMIKILAAKMDSIYCRQWTVFDFNQNPYFVLVGIETDTKIICCQQYRRFDCTH